MNEIERVEVTQADIEAFKEIFDVTENFMDPEGDDLRVLQILARHRIAALRESEPVAWLYRDDFDRSYTSLTRHQFRLDGKGWTETPLYALPTPPETDQ